MSIKIDVKIFALIFFLLLGRQSDVYLIIFAFAIIHELGHLICGLVLGLRPESIKIMPVGLSILFKRKTISWTKEMLVCFAGPLVNFIIAYLLIVSDRTIQSLNIIYANLLIGIFNLIPIIPLDGGRMLKIILKRFCPLTKAYWYLRIISNIAMVILSIIAIIGTFYLKNIFILVTLGYLWVIVITENKKIKMESMINPFLNTKTNVDKKKI